MIRYFLRHQGQYAAVRWVVGGIINAWPDLMHIMWVHNAVNTLNLVSLILKLVEMENLPLVEHVKKRYNVDPREFVLAVRQTAA